MKNKVLQTIFIVLTLVGVAVIVGSTSNIFGVSTPVYEANTLEERLDVCQNSRADLMSETGKQVDNCQLVCPMGVESNGDGTFSYEYSNNGLYSGSFDNLKCDYITGQSGDNFYSSSFVSWKARSSGTTIRFDETQIGTGKLIDSYEAREGVVQKIEADFQLVDSSGNTFGEVYTSIKYQLQCFENGVVEGKKVAGDEGGLGECRYSSSNPDMLVDGLIEDNKLLFDTVDSGSDVVVNGKFQATESGTAYIYSALLDENNNLFSIITGRGTVDVCDNNEHLAGKLYRDLSSGDTVIFQNSISTNSLPSGDYTVITGVSRGCDDGTVVEREVGTVTVQGNSKEPREEAGEETGVDVPVGELDEVVVDGTDEALERGLTSGSTCDASTDMRVDGCQIASCVDGEVKLLDPNSVSCDGSGNTTEEQAGEVVNNIPVEQEKRGWLGGFNIQLIGAILLVLGSVGWFWYREQ